MEKFILFFYRFFSSTYFTGYSGHGENLRAVDVMAILHEKVAFLSGGRDTRGGPLLTFPACESREKLKHTDYRPLLHYLTRIPT